MIQSACFGLTTLLFLFQLYLSGFLTTSTLDYLALTECFIYLCSLLLYTVYNICNTPWKREIQTILTNHRKTVKENKFITSTSCWKASEAEAS